MRTFAQFNFTALHGTEALKERFQVFCAHIVGQSTDKQRHFVVAAACVLTCVIARSARLSVRVHGVVSRIDLI
jgi:hypothetical protein